MPRSRGTRARATRGLVPAVIVAGLLAALAGCGSGGGSSSGSSTSGGGSGAKVHTIGFVAAGADDPFWLATVRGAEEAGQGGKIKVLTANAKTSADITGMVPVVQDMLTRNPEALVVPGVPQLLPVLKQAQAQNIPIIFYADGIPGSTIERTTVITDNMAAGEKAGNYIKQQLHGRGTLAILDIQRGTYPLLDQRAQGVLAALQGTQIRVVSHLDTACDTQRSVAAMQDILTRTPNVDAVFGACGGAILGAEQAIKAAHRDPNGITVVGFDGKPAEFDAIRAGDEDATVVQFPVRMGKEAVEVANDVLNGKSVNANIDSGSVLVTRANAAQYANLQ